jgi:ribosomal protein S12 methylthiotransferase accessory factor
MRSLMTSAPMTANTRDSEDTDVLASVETVVSPLGLTEPEALRRFNRADGLCVAGASAAGNHGDRSLKGSGRSPSLQLARRLAIAELIERHAGDVLPRRNVIVSTWRDLADRALPIGDVPRCSAAELSKNPARVQAVDPDQPLRWVPAIRLADGCVIFVPLVMAYVTNRRYHGEMYWNPISTGAAAHTSMASAVAAGIREVIERDAIALTWHQMLPLPRLNPDGLASHTQELIEKNHRTGIETMVFDGTTDLAVPTAYCLALADHVTQGAQVLGAGTGTTIAAAADTAVREAVALTEFVSAAEVPASPDDIREVVDGAAYMGIRERRHAFDFLINSHRYSTRWATAHVAGGDALCELAHLVALLQETNMNIYVVDQTTAEARAAGLVVVKVIIPQLQPMSLKPHIQYKAHPRLYSAPAAMGYPVRDEQNLNPYPQPFA